MSALSEAATFGSRLRPDQSDGGEEEKERSQSDVSKEKKMQRFFAHMPKKEEWSVQVGGEGGFALLKLGPVTRRSRLEKTNKPSRSRLVS